MGPPARRHIHPAPAGQVRRPHRVGRDHGGAGRLQGTVDRAQLLHDHGDGRPLPQDLRAPCRRHVRGNPALAQAPGRGLLADRPGVDAVQLRRRHPVLDEDQVLAPGLLLRHRHIRRGPGAHGHPHAGHQPDHDVRRQAKPDDRLRRHADPRRQPRGGVQEPPAAGMGGRREGVRPALAGVRRRGGRRHLGREPLAGGHAVPGLPRRHPRHPHRNERHGRAGGRPGIPGLLAASAGAG
nr:MAG TPA: hypothetical protein [Caudoviricetes sp.]